MGNWKTKLLKNVSLEKNSLYEKDSLFPVFRMSCWVVLMSLAIWLFQRYSRDDDPNDKRFHFSKGQIWHTKEYDFRCGDDGFQVYKCKPSAKELVHTGVAWFDRENVLNICQLT
ncbi:hypothetical protein M3Y95_00239500 [Aphelenchoides besseyi]|nr:hypothetical protein M3Y95_00239500 [Aphelenchoides besseyi]